jgi:hypothetical protein
VSSFGDDEALYRQRLSALLGVKPALSDCERALLAALSDADTIEEMLFCEVHRNQLLASRQRRQTIARVRADDSRPALWQGSAEFHEALKGVAEDRVLVCGLADASSEFVIASDTDVGAFAAVIQSSMADGY